MINKLSITTELSVTTLLCLKCGSDQKILVTHVDNESFRDQLVCADCLHIYPERE